TPPVITRRKDLNRLREARMCGTKEEGWAHPARSRHPTTEVAMLKKFLIQAIAAGIAVLVAAKIMPGVRIRKSGTAFGVAAPFAILNPLVGWLLKVVLAVVLLPAAIVTLGLPYLLLGLIVNTILLYITDKVIDDFEIKGFVPLVGTAGLISLAAW